MTLQHFPLLVETEVVRSRLLLMASLDISISCLDIMSTSPPPSPSSLAAGISRPAGAASSSRRCSLIIWSKSLRTCPSSGRLRKLVADEADPKLLRQVGLELRLEQPTRRELSVLSCLKLLLFLALRRSVPLVPSDSDRVALENGHCGTPVAAGCDECLDHL
jgi:hypothetical protein